MIKKYFELVKPGIIFGNWITAAAGFFLASRGNFSPLLFSGMLFGLSLVIASGCVFNNYIDRGIDALMERTRNRALVVKKISNRAAIIYGIILGILGFSALAIFTNIFAFSAAASGFFFYVYMYSRFKRSSVHGTLIGAVSGAMPPVVGYTAVTNNFDSGALLLFLILICWQMPHFYAIGIYRKGEYAAAGIPILPVKNGIRITKINIFLFIMAFSIISPMLFFFGYAGYIYLGFSLLLSFSWLIFAVQGFWASDDVLWARKMFKFSLIVLTVLSVTIIFDAI
jgi:protoheme IX farnesyltransferase